jgi:alkylation response protein AidB-like acyl-CoA dehydrogenase
MIHPAGQAGPGDSPILHAAIAMTPTINTIVDEIERERRLPQPVVREMERGGIFGMAMPRAWGGPELDPMTQFRVIEALAMVDGSVGWCAMINCDGGYVTAFLDQDVARAMYPDISVATAATVTPAGRAQRVPGGYRLSGRFPFTSGCHHCEWAWVGCTVIDEDRQLVTLDGVPQTRQCLVRISQCEILDTWYTTGLRGTGSNDLAVDGVFVEAERTFSFQDEGLIKRSGALYAFPYMYVAKASAPALGIARHVIDLLINTTSHRAARRYTIGQRVEPPKLIRDDVFIQEVVGRAETMLTSVRAYQFEVIGDLWATLVAGENPTATQIARVTTIHTYVMGACADVVQLVCKAAGGTAVYQSGPYDRCLRDILTMNQHLAASLRTYEMAGRQLLGLEPLRWLL